jgi:hypothetical protein
VHASESPLLRVIYAADFYSFYLGISRLTMRLSLLWAASLPVDTL